MASIALYDLQAEARAEEEQTAAATAQMQDLKQQETEFNKQIVNQKHKIQAVRHTLQELGQAKHKAADELAALLLDIPELAALTARHVQPDAA